MTPDQALNTLSRCSSAGHFAGLLSDGDIDSCRVAVQVLRQAITPPADPPKEPETPTPKPE